VLNPESHQIRIVIMDQAKLAKLQQSVRIGACIFISSGHRHPRENQYASDLKKIPPKASGPSLSWPHC